jgi:hypothetical protein
MWTRGFQTSVVWDVWNAVYATCGLNTPCLPMFGVILVMPVRNAAPVKEYNMLTREEEILNKYPLLYKDKSLSPRESLMCFGFECGPGWYDILDRLSAKLEKEIEKFLQDNPQAEYAPRAVQVKEKYGSLRFYMHGSTEAMENFITEAEEESERTCENCGKEGKANDGGWIRVLCSKCRGE